MTRPTSDLGNSQSMIWLGQSLSPGVPLYNMAWRFDYRMRLDPQAFATAFQALVDRSDTLRLYFGDSGGKPYQSVRDTLHVELPVLDISGEPDPEAAAGQRMQYSATQAFDLGEVAWVSYLLKLADDHWAWFINMHHVVTDAWSIALLYNKQMAFYRLAVSGGLDDVPGLPAYTDYLQRELDLRESSEVARAREYWTEQASAPSGRVALFGQASRAKRTSNTRIELPFGEERSARLARLERDARFQSLSVHLTRFNLLATAVYAFLNRISGQTSITIGAPAHNRNSLELRETIGLFMEMFPLSAEVFEEDSFVTLYQRVSAATQGFLRHALSGTSSPALANQYNVVLNYIHAEFDPYLDQSAIPAWIHSGHVDPGHDLRIQFHDLEQNGSFLCQFDTSDDTFDEALQSAMPRYFLALVDAFLNDPSQRIAHVALASDADRQKYFIDFNAASTFGVSSDLILDRFALQVSSNPDAPAAKCGDVSLSYAELNSQSDQLAEFLVAHGVSREVPVGICMRRSVDYVVAVLGVLKSGGAAVLLERSTPAKRLEYVIRDAVIPLVLTDDGDACVQSANDPNAVRYFPVEAATSYEYGATQPPALDRVDERQLAYVIYTSGSTGFPKGVAVEHASLAAYIDWAHKTFTDGSCCDFPLYSSVGFDLTITSLFVPLICGGCVVVYPERGASSDLSVLQVFDDDAVDVVKLTPAHLSLVLEQAPTLNRIRTLILGGENLSTDLARRATDAWHQVTLFNEYGPTEGVVGCMVYRYDREMDAGAVVPIGIPATHQRIYVLDAGGNPQPFAVPGELCIAGRDIARGYLNREDLTTERFVEDPFVPGEKMYRTGDLARFDSAGKIECLGRIDRQIKLGSVRVEPAEVQQALLAFGPVSDCVVDVIEDKNRGAIDDEHRCTRCGLSSEYPGITFDENGVCRLCSEFDSYRKRADAYFGSLSELAIKIAAGKRRAKGAYDCIALLSGGKDSTYALYRLAELGPRILALTLDNGFISDGAKENIRKVVRSLGIDHRYLSTPSMNAIFTDSLERHSNVCHGCFKTIYTLAIKTALDEGIPQIITGLSRGQFFETRLTPDLFQQTEIDVASIDQTVLEARKAYHRIDDAVSRSLDVDMFDDDTVFDKVEFVDFYRYCDVELGEIYRFLDEHAPWVRPRDTGRSTNCLINDAGIHVHKNKEGFHNYALPYSWDVRMGHKTRESALEELNDRIDVGKVKDILEEIGYTEDYSNRSDAGKRLIAYYVSEDLLDEETLRKHAAKYVPEVMIPASFVAVSRIPLTGNGKVDLSALPKPDLSRPRLDHIYRPPETALQKRLADIWRGVLNTTRVGLSDNYYALGGDSISAIKISVRAREEGIALTATDVFDHQTIASLADFLEMRSCDPDQAIAGPLTEIERPERFSMADLDEEKARTLARLLGKKGS